MHLHWAHLQLLKHSATRAIHGKDLLSCGKSSQLLSAFWSLLRRPWALFLNNLLRLIAASGGQERSVVAETYSSARIILSMRVSLYQKISSFSCLIPQISRKQDCTPAKQLRNMSKLYLASALATYHTTSRHFPEIYPTNRAVCMRHLNEYVWAGHEIQACVRYFYA